MTLAASGATPARRDAAVAQFVTTLAAVIALGIAIGAPGLFWWATRARMQAEMAADARIVAAAVSAEAARNPDLWMFQGARIAGLLDAAGADPAMPERRRVYDLAQRLIAEEPATLPAPITIAVHPVYDLGRKVGAVEMARSLQPVVQATFAVAVAAIAIALLAFALLRSVPLRLLRRALDRADHLASHDALTGLPNRARFHAELRHALAQQRRSTVTIAALMIDLDRFKPVNDVYGHAAGDRVLQMVAQRLLACAREGDTVARLGGDEFAIVASLGSSAADGAGRLAHRVVHALEEPFEIADGTVVQIGVSIGIAVGSAPAGIEAEKLLMQADVALYRAKAEGRGCFRFFEPGMDIKLRERARLETELRQALHDGAIEPHFQPLVALSSGRLIGFEMLARWPHPDRGMVSPAEFIPVAEDAGLIALLTETLLRRGCLAARSWPADLTLAVNVSPLQLRDRALPAMIRAALAESGLTPERLEIELTESALLADFALARTILDDLKALGVRLALDDFGTGYSSLRHLQMLPIDKIKIDAGFVRAMRADADSRKIVAAVIGLGHSLGLPIVAEGVEDAAAAEAVAELGCDVGQGWLFGAALPEAGATDLARATPETAAATMRWTGPSVRTVALNPA